jgi:hypothetical protein
MAVSGAGAMLSTASTTGAHHSPSVSSVGSPVPEHNPSMATLLKHFQFNEMPPTALMPVGLTISPAMQAIIVDCVSIVNPQLAAIVGQNAEAIMARSVDSHAACPAYCEVIASFES